MASLVFLIRCPYLDPWITVLQNFISQPLMLRLPVRPGLTIMHLIGYLTHGDMESLSARPHILAYVILLKRKDQKGARLMIAEEDMNTNAAIVLGQTM